jgi:hypothetical protein
VMQERNSQSSVPGIPIRSLANPCNTIKPQKTEGIRAMRGHSKVNESPNLFNEGNVRMKLVIGE